MRVLADLGFRDDCRQVYERLKILTVPSQYILENLRFLNRNVNLYRSHSYDTRHKYNMIPAYWRLKRCQTGPVYWAIKFFNVLPENIRNLPEKNFETIVRQILIRNSFYSIHEYLRYNFNYDFNFKC